MDPHYFEEKIDEESMLEQVRFIRRIAKTEPIASHIGWPLSVVLYFMFG
jgi:hypothetical protein